MILILFNRRDREKRIRNAGVCSSTRYIGFAKSNYYTVTVCETLLVCQWNLFFKIFFFVSLHRLNLAIINMVISFTKNIIHLNRRQYISFVRLIMTAWIRSHRSFDSDRLVDFSNGKIVTIVTIATKKKLYYYRCYRVIKTRIMKISLLHSKNSLISVNRDSRNSLIFSVTTWPSINHVQRVTLKHMAEKS